MKAKFKEGDTVYFRGESDYQEPLKVLKVYKQGKHVMYDIQWRWHLFFGISQKKLVKKNKND